MLGLVTAAVAAPLDPDLQPLAAALRERLGQHGVEVVSWDDPSVDWTSFDAVVIRSTWDYPSRRDEFGAWLDRVDGSTRLINGSAAVRWNLDKRYLADLAAAGIPITPTRFVALGEAAPSVEGLHVVKPTVGAGSSGARRCEPHEVAEHVATLHEAGHVAMVQPYLDRIDELGESAFCFVPGSTAGLELSHVFSKAAILTSTEVEQEGDLYAKEQIAPRTPTEEEQQLAMAVLATDLVASFDDLLFARVDIAPWRDPSGRDTYVVMELELIEPSFYLHTASGAAERFAERIVDRLRLLEGPGSVY